MTRDFIKEQCSEKKKVVQMDKRSDRNYWNNSNNHCNGICNVNNFWIIFLLTNKILCVNI